MNYPKILNEIYQIIKQNKFEGQMPEYIPELSKISPEKFGMNFMLLSGKSWGIGDYQEKFSIQSIAKVFAFSLAYKILGSDIFSRLGVEPSVDPFNSLIRLEQENGIPRNPLINPGAIVVCDILVDQLENPERELFDFIRKISGFEKITYNQAVYLSEKRTGDRNRALIYLMKSFGNIHHNPEQVLNLYFKLCSIEMTVEELSQSFLIYANGGGHPVTGMRLIGKSQTKRINAIMQTCGFYDEAGEFTFRVGLPGKSGVGGGIVAVHPGKFSVATWSPLLNEKGNSIAGMKALEMLTTRLGWSVF